MEKRFISKPLKCRSTELVNPQTAKLAKLVGFDWNLIEFSNGSVLPFSNCYKEVEPGKFEVISPKKYNPKNPHIPAVSQDLLHRWIRKELELYVLIEKKCKGPWTYSLYEIKPYKTKLLRTFYQNDFIEYEEALEIGLQQAMFYYYIEKTNIISDIEIPVEKMIEIIIKYTEENKINVLND